MTNTPESSPFAKAYNLTVDATTNVLSDRIREFEKVKKGSEKDLRERDDQYLLRLSEDIFKNSQDEIAAQVRKEMRKGLKGEPSPEDIEGENKILAIIQEARTDIVARVLYPALSEVSKNQLEGWRNVRVETKNLLKKMRGEVDMVLIASAEKKFDPQVVQHIHEFRKRMIEAEKLPPKEREEMERMILNEQFNEFIDPIYQEIRQGKIRFTNPKTAAIVNFRNNPSSPEAREKMKDPHTLEFFYDYIQTKEARLQKYSPALSRMSGELQDGESAEDAEKGKKKAFADYALTQIALEVEAEIQKDQELKTIYETVNKGRVPQEVQVFLDKVSEEESGAFAQLLQKPDGIVRFFVNVVIPLWLKFTGAVNTVAFLQNPKNKGAMLYAVAGIGLGTALDKNKSWINTEDDVMNAYKNLDSVKKSEYRKLFCDPEKGDLETMLAKTINLNDVKSSNITVKKGEKGWGKEELEKIRSNPRYVEGSENQRKFDEIFSQMGPSYFQEEQNQRRQEIYTDMSKFSTIHETRALIDIIKDPPEQA